MDSKKKNIIIIIMAVVMLASLAYIFLLRKGIKGMSLLYSDSISDTSNEQ